MFDKLYYAEDSETSEAGMSDSERVIAMLEEEGPKPIRELQAITNYKSRSQFLAEIINPLIQEERIYRDGSDKSPKALIKLKRK